MNLIAYVRENLTGALQIISGRPEGLARLDTSIEGFWHSFALVVVIAPLAFLALIDQPTEPVPTTAAALTGGSIARYAVTLLVDWFAFPLLFAMLAPAFGLGSRYIPFIVARNWASVIISAMVSSVHALRIVGVLPEAILPYALLVALAVALRFSYVIIRTTLAVSMTMALPILVFDFLLSLLIWSVFEHFA